jgi:hypothetical protein
MVPIPDNNPVPQVDDPFAYYLVPFFFTNDGIERNK